MICRTEAGANTVLPLLTCLLPSTVFRLHFAVLVWVLCLDPPLVMSNLELEALQMGFYILDLSSVLLRTQGLRISPFEVIFGKSELGPNLFFVDAGTQWLASSSGIITVLAEQTTGKEADHISQGLYLFVQGLQVGTELL